MRWGVIRETFGWGFLLWLIGYVLGIVLFFLVPASILGWIIMPIGVVVTIWVLFKRIKSTSMKYYLLLGLSWAFIAVVFDYFFLVKVFNPADGYYKLDVYIYYLLTLFLPIIVGWYKGRIKADLGRRR